MAAAVLLAAGLETFAPITASVLAIAVFVLLVFVLSPTIRGGSDASRQERRSTAEDVDRGTELDADEAPDRDRREVPAPPTASP